MKNKLLLILFVLVVLGHRSLFAEWKSIDGTPAKEGDILFVSLKDLHPTQPVVGFDEIYYKLGRFQEDRRKIFREYCKHNGQLELLTLSDTSDLHDTKSFSCLQPVGMSRDDLKTAVMGPDNQLYLTNGHHTFIEFWQMPEGGPDIKMHVVLKRDYRFVASMDEFWEKMKSEQNVWLVDANNEQIPVASLPNNFDLKKFRDDPYRSLLYFTRKIAWNSPEHFAIPDSDEFYPAIPFCEFYWAREVRKTVDLDDYDLNAQAGYVSAIRAVGQAVMKVRTNNVGDSGKALEEMGQFRYFNERELDRISRPDTGKLAYMLKYKTAHSPNTVASQNQYQAKNPKDVSSFVSD